MPSCTEKQRRKAVENGRGVRRVGDARDAQAGISHAPNAVPMAESARRVADIDQIIQVTGN